ncbi:MAG: PAS domain S-box protein [Verrucomicrobia bacterium]|nr:PAS domain S-box protein [Verrucomicrobiota bacterium]
MPTKSQFVASLLFVGTLQAHARAQTPEPSFVTGTPILQAQGWTSTHTWLSIGTITALIAAAVAWAATLRRRVRIETEAIRARLERETSMQARYRDLVENAFDIVYTHDLEGRFTSLNASASRITGYTREEALGMTVAQLVAPDHLGRAQEMTRRKARGETLTTYELDILTKDGRRRTVEISSRPLVESGRTIGIQGVARDVTERKTAEAALRESEIKFRTLVNAMDDIVFTLDREQRHTGVYGKWLEKEGIAPEFFLGKTACEALGPSASPVHEEANRRALAGEHVVYEWSVTRPLAKQRYFETSLSPIRNAAGDIVGIVGVGRDITKAKNSEIRMAAFSALGQRLSLATKPRDAASIIAEVADSLFGWDACTVDLYDADKDEVFPLLNVDILNGQRTPVEPARVGTPATGKQRHVLQHGPELILRREPFAFPPESIPFGDTSRPSASLMLTRIRNASKVIGLLSVQSYAVNAYTAEDLGTLQTLADLCAGALERIRAAEALRQTEARYHSIFEHAVEGLAQVTPEGRFLTANPALARMLGFASPEEMMASVTDIGQQLYVDPGWRRTLTGQLKEKGFIKGYEVQAYRKDGQIIWVSISSHVARDESGKILHFESVIEDITDRKRAEAEIQKLAAFPRLNPNPILEFDAAGNLVYFNAAARVLAESLGCGSLPAVLPPDTAQIVKECLHSGKSRSQHETKVGERTVAWSFFPIGESQVVHCYAADITERLNLETQLRHIQKLESIGQLAAGVAHDFNNLLTIIQGYTSLLQNSEDAQADLREALAQIGKAAQRGAELTRQLLTFSRRQPMRPVLLDLNEVVRNVGEILQRVLGEHVALQLKESAALPLIEADLGMVEQIIMNLAVNARDAMPQGGALTLSTEAIEIDTAYVGTHPEAVIGPHVCLTVSDTGIGMDAATLGRIFEPFFTTKDVGKGTGLGLATVYGVVKQHQGWIEVSSALGRGSAFKVFLPATRKQAGERGMEKPTKTGLEGKGETILVVEDEPALRSLARRVLQNYGYSVLEAGSGSEALDVWEKHTAEIHLLLTDMVMPGGVTGRELARRLRIRDPLLKVIYTSGYSPEAVAEGLELIEGVNFLAKPYRPGALARIVQARLNPDARTAQGPIVAF